jgi:hypothetical protein
MTMLTDGLKAKNSESVEVKDIAELVLESIKGTQVSQSMN